MRLLRLLGENGIGERLIMDNTSCTNCGHYQLKLMVTSGKPYGYSGDIPCLRCSRFSQLEDLHTGVGSVWVASSIPEGK